MKLSILSIDGGGIRGVLPAAVLSAWERETEKSVSDYFDLIVGTSTGSILAGALALGVGATDCLELYRKHGDLIFHLWPRRSIFVAGAIAHGGTGRFIRRWFRPPYNMERLKSILDEIYGHQLIDDCRTRLCICSTNGITAQPRVFKTNHHDDLFTDYKLHVSDAVSASCAAPSFFPSHAIGDADYIDGGLWANNPSLVALIEARRLQGELDLNEISLVSIGCGSVAPIFKRATLQKGWGLTWLKRSPEFFLNVGSASVHNSCNLLLPSTNYLRIDKVLPDKIAQLDNPNNLSELISIGEELGRKSVLGIDFLAGEQIQERFVPSRKQSTEKLLDETTS